MTTAVGKREPVYATSTARISAMVVQVEVPKCECGHWPLNTKQLEYAVRTRACWRCGSKVKVGLAEGQTRRNVTLKPAPRRNCP